MLNASTCRNKKTDGCQASKGDKSAQNNILAPMTRRVIEQI
jgi:hypothetical protein